MLELTRRVGEEVLIGNATIVRVTEIRGSIVRLGFHAPLSVPIVRNEINEREARALLAKKLANEIANNIFKNGIGIEAERLVLESYNKKDLGGVCRGAVVDRIVDQILRHWPSAA